MLGIVVVEDVVLVVLEVEVVEVLLDVVDSVDGGGGSEVELGKETGGVEVSEVEEGTGGDVLVVSLVGEVLGAVGGSRVGGLPVLVELLVAMVNA